VAHLSLYSENGQRIDNGPSPLTPSPPSLYGNLFASVDQLEDLQGNMGFFFLFPDISVRWRGRYQLGVTLMRIARRVNELECLLASYKLMNSSSPDAHGVLRVEEHGLVLAEARSRLFEVLPPQQYSAVRAFYSQRVSIWSVLNPFQR
jgi:hypothetical protein